MARLVVDKTCALITRTMPLSGLWINLSLHRFSSTPAAVADIGLIPTHKQHLTVID
jgi:hypothetical protein